MPEVPQFLDLPGLYDRPDKGRQRRSKLFDLQFRQLHDVRHTEINVLVFRYSYSSNLTMIHDA